MKTIKTLSHQKITGITSNLYGAVWALTRNRKQLRTDIERFEKVLVDIYEKDEEQFLAKVSHGVIENEEFLIPVRSTIEKDWPELRQGMCPEDWPNVPEEVIEKYLDISADIQINMMVGKIGLELELLNK